jgi:hypothetical protein
MIPCTRRCYRAEALEAPLYLRPGVPPKAARDAYFSNLPEPINFFLSIAGWGWHADTAVHVLRMAVSGALDRHPKLQLVIGHLGEGLAEMFARFDQILTPRLPKGTVRTVREMLEQQVHVTISGFTYPAMFQTFWKPSDRIGSSLLLIIHSCRSKAQRTLFGRCQSQAQIWRRSCTAMQIGSSSFSLDFREVCRSGD